jgi:hypothetical protein
MQQFFTLLFTLLLFFSVNGQQIKPPVEVYLKQDRDSILLNNNTVKIKPKPFTLIFVYNNPDEYNGIFVNTSFLKDYYNLDPSETIKDLNYLPQKVYSENKFNPYKELKVNPEFFQYFGYNPNANWNKFDRLIKRNGKIIAYRKVTNFYVVDEKNRIPVEEMKFNIYMIFDVIDQNTGKFYNREINRAKAKLKF